MTDAISKAVKKENFSLNEARQVMDNIMSGYATPAQIGGFLAAMRMKGETVDEITGFAQAMRDKATKIAPDVPFLVDTCGTGGDGANTFNISTAAAFVASAAGVPVAKHGNRAVSSKSGSADVLQELGVVIDISPENVRRCIEETSMGFMFAPAFHSAMKHAIGPRRELGIRTVFNILGPLTNPAEAKGQLMGVFEEDLSETLANVLFNLGTQHALVIYGKDRLDEISISAPTKVCEIKDGFIRNYCIEPEDFGFQRRKKEDVKGGDAKSNAEIIRSIFKGEKGARRDIVELNAGAAIYVGNGAQSIKEGVSMAREIIESGKAYDKIEELAEFTKSAAEAV